MKAIRLQTEYLTTPLGLGITAPRFSWNCEGGVKQTAYRILTERGGETVWDSGKVASSSMTHIQYAGMPLQSRDQVEWSVVLWDENDVPGEDSASWFELGLMNRHLSFQLHEVRQIHPRHRRERDRRSAERREPDQVEGHGLHDAGRLRGRG